MGSTCSPQMISKRIHDLHDNERTSVIMLMVIMTVMNDAKQRDDPAPPSVARGGGVHARGGRVECVWRAPGDLMALLSGQATAGDGDAVVAAEGVVRGDVGLEPARVEGVGEARWFRCVVVATYSLHGWIRCEKCL